MSRQRATALVSFVVAVAAVQVVAEDVVVFLGATGALDRAGIGTPYVMVAVPYVLFLLLFGALFTWALAGDEPDR